MTAIYASHNGSEDNPQIFDLRMALQYMGALLPERHEMEQFYTGVEDTRGTDDFISWFGGHESREIRRIAKEERDDIDAPMTDYLLGMFFELEHLMESGANPVTQRSSLSTDAPKMTASLWELS